jgi:FhuF 2Fe-2S C-terminal domain
LAAGDLLGPVPVELDLQLKLAAERLGTDSLAVAASALLEGYALALGLPLFAALATGAPPPDLAAGNVRLRFAGGRPPEVEMRDPSPPPGGRAGAVARMVDGHLAALVARLAERRVRRGPRALWGLVANGCPAALLEQAQAAGLPPGRVGPLLDLLVGVPGRPLPAPALLQVGPADGPGMVRRRVTCCLNYTVAGQPCATCPLLPPAETRRRLAAGSAAAGT